MSNNSKSQNQNQSQNQSSSSDQASNSNAAANTNTADKGELKTLQDRITELENEKKKALNEKSIELSILQDENKRLTEETRGELDKLKTEKENEISRLQEENQALANERLLAEEKLKSLSNSKPVKLDLVAGGTMTGNKDESKDPLQFDNSWAKSVVVRQSEVKKVGDGKNDYVEVPSSVRVVPYDKPVFEHMKSTQGFAGLKIVVLHEPEN